MKSRLFIIWLISSAIGFFTAAPAAIGFMMKAQLVGGSPLDFILGFILATWAFFSLIFYKRALAKDNLNLSYFYAASPAPIGILSLLYLLYLAGNELK